MQNNMLRNDNDEVHTVYPIYFFSLFAKRSQQWHYYRYVVFTSQKKKNRTANNHLAYREQNRLHKQLYHITFILACKLHIMVKNAHTPEDIERRRE